MAAGEPGAAVTVWQGRSWRLQVQTRQLPDGTLWEQGVIQHPGAVVLVPLRPGDHGPEVLMVVQYRLAIDTRLLELPAGTRGESEPWPACAQRELREETGFRAAELHSLGAIWPAPGVSSEQMRIYLATGLTPDPLPADADEAIELQPMPLDALLAMARDGRLQDAKSIIGIWRAARYLAGGA